jgi:leader peptidase (prepilin peptidase)/N-methyltransferase
MSSQNRCSEALVKPESGRVARDVNRSDILGAPLLAAAGLAVATSLYAVPGFAGLAGGGLGLIMMTVAVIDAQFLIIPDELCALAVALGLLDVGIGHSQDLPAAVLDPVLRAAAMAAVFLGFRLGYRRLRGREGMGLGDVKLAGVAGIWLDGPSLPIAVELGALGALGFVALRVIRKRNAPDPLTKLPFGSFFAPAIWACWLLQRWWNSTI